jgi:aminoglycoside 2'-N-acetyltransferase I
MSNTLGSRSLIAERLGWERWRGPSYVRAANGTMTRSADEDGGIMILRCTPSRGVDLTATIACDERPGDSW